MLIALISWIITGIIFRFATNAIVKNKGYREIGSGGDSRTKYTYDGYPYDSNNAI